MVGSMQIFSSKRASIDISKIVGLAVGLYAAAAILPTAIVEITNSTNWAGAPTPIITLGTTVVGIVAVTAFILMLLRQD